MVIVEMGRLNTFPKQTPKLLFKTLILPMFNIDKVTLSVNTGAKWVSYKIPIYSSGFFLTRINQLNTSPVK